MGFPTTLSMSLGMLVGWAVLSPVSKLSGWAPGPTGDMATGARGWILWVSLAIMCTDSVVSLLPVVWEFVQDWYHKRASTDDDDEPPNRLVPTTWVLAGMGGSVVLGTVLVWVVFGDEGIRFWATLIGFAMGCLLSVLGFVSSYNRELYLLLQRACLGRNRS